MMGVAFGWCESCNIAPPPAAGDVLFAAGGGAALTLRGSAFGWDESIAPATAAGDVLFAGGAGGTPLTLTVAFGWDDESIAPPPTMNKDRSVQHVVVLPAPTKRKENIFFKKRMSLRVFFPLRVATSSRVFREIFCFSWNQRLKNSARRLPASTGARH